MLDFSNALINWYKQCHRKLPWRDTKDPYLIWLSEVILQQTRVEQGLPYFLNFSNKYPTVIHLANADEEEVLKLWQGLGYYSRGRNLLKTAKFIAFNLNGVFPSDFNGLLKLTGVGEYTAAAIASFAFDLPYPVVDGNVFRVISRIYGIDSPVPKARKEFYEIALELMDKKNPAFFNQAIMEFGATLCTPQKPGCSDCPFLINCFAFNNNAVNSLPVKLKKAAKKERFISFFFIDFDGKTLLSKRTKKDIWQNLYEFPSIESNVFLDEEETLIAFIEKYKIENCEVVANPYKVKHILTHQNINAVFFCLKTVPSVEMLLKYQTVDIETLSKFAIPRIMERFLDHLT
jgi:A/G-specific adenine glycosylase